MNNQPAFPIVEPCPEGVVSVETGMTLRDYFAAQVLPSIYTQTAKEYIEGRINVRDASSKGMAYEAYLIADAMLVERERGGKK